MKAQTMPRIPMLRKTMSVTYIERCDLLSCLNVPQFGRGVHTAGRDHRAWGVKTQTYLYTD